MGAGPDNMKIVIAPDKFKDSIPAIEAARAMSQGVRGAIPDAEIDECPMADGGEGTVTAMVTATRGRIEIRRVTGPLPGMHVEAPIGLLGDGTTAVIEMASASGLHLLKPEQRNPMRTTTFGTGELLRAAVELGATRIILGIGGSATLDGGVGMAQAWGAQITLANGTVYDRTSRKLVGSDMSRVLDIARAGAGTSLSRRRVATQDRKALTSGGGGMLDTENVEFIVACDVGNPLYGRDGAAAIFGPQKGATPAQVEQLDQALRQLATRCGAVHLADTPGAGAAGGLGFGMRAFFGATLRSGVDIVLDATRLRDRLRGADLCLTGEGRLDAQSVFGKTPIGVSRLCKELNIPCIAIVGTIGHGAEACLSEGLTAYFSICNQPMALADAMRDASPLLTSAAANLARIFQMKS